MGETCSPNAWHVLVFPAMKHGLLVGRAVVAAALAVAVLMPAAASRVAATPVAGLWFDTDTAATVAVGAGADGAGPVLRDGYGREVVLRGFNVSGEVKLAENSGLPFADVADARASAAAMRRLTGANTVRFLLGWSWAEPAPGEIDHGYLDRVAEQLGVFLDDGFRVVLDWHQDLYSRYLFDEGSWYTGDGAPQWVISAGGYPKESCGICVQWGQNMTQNTAVISAAYDFWHNRSLTTTAGTFGVQDGFLRTAGRSLAYLKGRLTASQYAGIVGVDPYNEPFPGRFDSGQDGASWERDLLWPFYQRFRAEMDRAGWSDRAALVEPNPFWNINIPFVAQSGGFGSVGTLGTRYMFNAHFYDAAELSGILMWGDASSGRYRTDFATIRARARALGTAAIVTEFGSPLSGSVAGKTPSVLKAVYQSLDSTVPGSSWWTSPTSSGTVLSGTAWQWDIYSGRHREYMNGNRDKLLTEADAWNEEDFSLVARNDDGALALRQDSRVLDRVYPEAVSGTTLAFTYEDLARDGGTVMRWNGVPSDMPNLAEVVGDRQFAVLVWTSAGIDAPTELHLPASFPASVTTVVSDLGTETSLPDYAPGRPISVAGRPGPSGVDRLLLATTDTGRVHVALVTSGTTAAPGTMAAARGELMTWAESAF